MDEQWLRLTDYASKYRISTSTLRRRIKHGQIKHRLDGGKYLLLDEPPSFADFAPDELPQQSAFADLAALRAHGESQGLIEETQEKLNLLRASPAEPVEAHVMQPANDDPILSSANRLLVELKRAYTNVLQEKEEQIIQLKEEVTDLKTLVRVLEDHNERMSRTLQHYERGGVMSMNLDR